jgi:hypothetical protein
LGQLRCGLDQAHASLFHFLSFFSNSIKNRNLAKFAKKIIEKSEKYQTSLVSFIKI